MRTRLWSLIDIMNEFRASALGSLTAQAQVMLSTADAQITLMKRGETPPEPMQMHIAGDWVTNAKQFCTDVGLNESFQQITLAEHYLFRAGDLTVRVFHSEIRRMLETIIVELTKRKFLFISADRTGLFDNEFSFGTAVIKKFPLAKGDIVAAGNCLCAECHTASVFHLMLAFEWALRTFCAELGLQRMKDFDKKSGKFKYSPASFAMWEKILGQLGKRVEKRIESLRKGPRKQHLQEHYSSILEDIKFAKDAWRNHVMHCRKTFERGEAHDLFIRVKSMMERMAHEKPFRV